MTPRKCVRSRLRLVGLGLLAALVLRCPAGAQTYSASVGSGMHYGHTGVLHQACEPDTSNYTRFDSAKLPGILFLRLLLKDGRWVATTVSGKDWSSFFGWMSTYVSTLSPSGVVTTIESGSFVLNLPDIDRFTLSKFWTVSSTETVDLNTGKYTWHQVVHGWEEGSIQRRSRCGSFVETVDDEAYLPVLLTPTTSRNRVSIVSPFPLAYKTVDASSVVSSPPATGLAADGISAAVVVYESNSDAQVTFTIAAPTAVGPFGSLAQFDPNYISNPSPTTGVTSLAVTTHSCSADGRCTFLALLWAPPAMPMPPVSTAATTSISAINVTVTATQAAGSGGVAPPPSTASVLLVPPPLLLVHGIWSSASEAFLSSSGSQSGASFFQWISGVYPLGSVILPVDYGNWRSKAFSDPNVQKQFSTTLNTALAKTAAKGIVARKVDVVAHSMGGLVTRYFLSYPPPDLGTSLPTNPVHKLITMGTPHRGSALATALDRNETAPNTSPLIAAKCIAQSISPCTAGNLFASMGRRLDTGTKSLEPGSPQLLALTPPSDTYGAIAGLAPILSPTGIFLDHVVGAFLPLQTVDSILGTSLHDTIVPWDSQRAWAADVATIPGIVHVALAPWDTGETSSSDVRNQVLYWLMGGTGQRAASSAVSEASGAQHLALAAASSSSAPVLDLTGYTQVAASNVSFSPATNSALTINAPANIAASSRTKTITEVLLLQTVADPTDVPLLFATQSPFSIWFTPARLGSADFTAVVLFSDKTYAAAALHYTLQPSGNLIALNLTDAPAASLVIGTSVAVHAQAVLFDGLLDVTQAATYNARSGTAAVFSVAQGGVITASGKGVDWLDVSYGGLTASAPITVGTCAYSLTPANQLVPSVGGSAAIQVTAAPGCAWTADSTDRWLTVSTPTGNGSGTVSVNAAPNSLGSTQVAYVTVAAQNAAITQPGTACTYSVSPSQVSATAAGGSGTLKVTTSCPVVLSSNASWLTGANLGSSVAYFVTANPGTSQRAATLTVGTATVIVTQAGASPTTASLSAASLAFGDQLVGTPSAAQSVTVTNGGPALLNITSVTITGPNSGDFVQGNTCGNSVPIGASCTISITFVPTAAGARTASVSIADNCLNSPQSVTLTGTGATPTTPPILNAGGTIDGASFRSPVAPGSIAAVFGTNLAVGLNSAAGVPLPTALGGLSMKFNGSVAAPFFFASPNQVNIQIPWELSGQTSATLVATTAAGSSSPVAVPVAAFAPAIFSLNQQGTGQGIVTIANSRTIVAPTGSVADADARPAAKGEYVTIYCVGLGDVNNRPATGAPALDGSSTTKLPVTVSLGSVTVPAAYAGLAPGFVGLFQVNVQVPPAAPSGRAVPLVLSVAGAASNSVTIAID